MDIEEIRKNKRLLEQQIGKDIAMFCRNHDLVLNDVEFSVKLTQSVDMQDPEVSDVKIKLKMEL